MDMFVKNYIHVIKNGFYKNNYQIIKNLKIDYNLLKNAIRRLNIEKNLFENLILKSLDNSDQANKYNKSAYMQEINWSVLALSFYRSTIHNFIQKERKFYKNLFFSNYDECINILDDIDHNISFSQWSVLMRLSIFFLKNDMESLNFFSEEIISKSNNIILQESIYFHTKKLTYIKDNYSFNEIKTMLYNGLYKSMSEKRVDGWAESFEYQEKVNKARIKEGLPSINELLLSITNEAFHYSEIYSFYPFNLKINRNDLIDILFKSSTLSIIDLYKTFIPIFSEFLIEQKKFSKELINDISIFSELDNLIKQENISNIQAIEKTINFSTKKLFITFEYFLKGNFDEVIKISLNTIKKEPYLIDYIYLLITSIIYAEKNIYSEMQKIKNNSFLFSIAITMYNIFTQNELSKNIDQMRKNLLIFGINSSWNIFLFNIFKNLLCQNKNIAKASFSQACIYSYLTHPRYYFKLQEKEKAAILDFMRKKNLDNTSCYNVFVSQNTRIDLSKYITPLYRARYLETLNSTMPLNELNDLYEQSIQTPFIHKLKIQILYVNKLIEIQDYSTALKIIIHETLYNAIPICIYNYQVFLTLDNDEIKALPHYTLLHIFHNRDSHINIYYALKDYLNSFDCDYSKPSLLIKNIDKNYLYLNELLEMLKNICESKILEEFIFQFDCSSDIIQEQITILELIDLHKALSNEERNKLKMLNLRLKHIYENHNLNSGRIMISVDKLMAQMIESTRNISIHDFISKPRWDKDTIIHWELTRSNLCQEDVILDLLDGILIDVFSAQTDGLNEQIEGRIKHTFFHERIQKVFIKNELRIRDIQNQNSQNIKVEINPLLQELSIKVNEEIENFKINELNVEKIYSDFFDFRTKHLYKREDLISIVDAINNTNEIDIKYLISDMLLRINTELENYSLKVEKNLKKKFFSLLKNFRQKMKNIPNCAKLDNTMQNLTKDIEPMAKEIASWLKSTQLSRDTSFTMKELMNIFQLEFSELINYDNIRLVEPTSYHFRPNTYHAFLYIFHNIFSNITKHSKITNNEILISFNEQNEFLVIVIENEFDNIEKPIFKENRGMKVIRSSLVSINKSNKLDYYSKDNRFFYKLTLNKQSCIND